MIVEPVWLAKDDVIDLHAYILARTGGALGLRDEGLLESALARPLNRFMYEYVDALPELAASYAVGIAKNHPFADGNKRSAFLALGLFLDLNGVTLTARDEDATTIMLAVASSGIEEDALATWIRDNTNPL
jgi:death-on-curing protein